MNNKWKKIIGTEGLYQHPNGKYYLRRNYPKRSFQSLRTENLKEAKERIRNFKDSHYSNLTKPNRRFITFGDVAENYQSGPLDRVGVKLKTKDNIINSLRHLKKMHSVWRKPLLEVKTKDLRTCIDGIPNLSNASKNYVVYAVNKVVEHATDLGVISNDSNTKVRSFSTEPRKLNLPLDADFKKVVQVLMYPDLKSRKKSCLPNDWELKSRNQLMSEMNVSVSTLKRRIAEHRRPHRLKPRPEASFTFLFLCFTGMRLGEAVKIKWSNIKSDHIVVEGTKTTAAHRILPIWGQLRELLNNIKAYRGSVSEDGFVIKRKRIDKALRIACRKVGVEYLRHHDLRHYFATKAIQSGVDIPTVSKWLGHADGGALAMKVYTNLMTDHLIEQSKKLKFADGLMDAA